MIEAPLLQTERLNLRPHRVEDFDRLAETYTQARSRYIGGPLPEAAVWKNFTADVGQWVLLGFGVWAIELKHTGDYIGQVGLAAPKDYPEGELGWLLWQELKAAFGFYSENWIMMWARRNDRRPNHGPCRPFCGTCPTFH